VGAVIGVNRAEKSIRQAAAGSGLNWKGVHFVHAVMAKLTLNGEKIQECS
jgi:hypothetical protein